MLPLAALLVPLLPGQPPHAESLSPVPTGAWAPGAGGTAADLLSVSAPDAMHAHAVGRQGAIVATDDGGEHWRQQAACAVSTPCSPSERLTATLHGVSFPDDHHGWAVGDRGTILATADAGVSWRRQTACLGHAPCSPPDVVTNDLLGVSFTDSSHGYAVGRQGTILVSDDGGTTWTTRSACTPGVECHDPHADLASVSASGASEAWAAGLDSIVAVTTDGGRRWAQGRLSAAREAAPDLFGIDLVVAGLDIGGEATFKAVGAGGAIVESNDQAAGWLRKQRAGTPNPVLPSGTTRTLRGVSFTDSAHGHVVGDGGTIRVTADGGQSWRPEASGTEHSLTAVAFPDANDGYAVGEAGTVLALHAPPPPGLVVRSVMPNHGPVSGQLPITITGSGFIGATGVSIGTSPATGFVVTADTSLTAVLPPHALGRVHVTVFTAAGASAVSTSDEVTYFSPGGGVWRSTGACRQACTGPPVALRDGRVLIEGAGSLEPEPEPTAAAEIYDPEAGRWTTVGPMSQARRSHTASRLADGRVLVAGGETPNGPTGSAEVYDPESGQWTRTRSMQHPRAHHAAVVLADGRVLVVGGDQGSTTEIYDPGSGSWSEARPTLRPRSDATALLLHDGRVLLVGGSSVSGDATAEIFDPAKAGWQPAGSLLVLRSGATATVLTSGRVLVAGGMYTTPFRANTFLPFAELYDPGKNSWQPTGPLVEARANHAAAVLPGGRVMVIGGGTWGTLGCPPCGLSAYGEIYDPETGEWQLTAPMRTPRVYHHAISLDNGTILVVGGVPYGERALTAAEIFVPAAGLVGGTTGGAQGAIALPFTLGGAIIVGAAAIPLILRRRNRRRRRQRLAAWEALPAPAESEREPVGTRG